MLGFAIALPNLPRWYYANHQGSVIATADAAGDADEIYTYSSFGVPGEQAPPLFGYTGQVWDEDVQLAYYKARYYSSERGRFVSTDPAGYIDSLNLYAYVVNDPVNLTDSTGNYVGIDDAIFIVGGTVVGVAAQGAVDLFRGKLSSPQDYAAAAVVGGAVAGESLLYLGPVAAGALGGAASNLTKQGLSWADGQQQGEMLIV